MNTAHRTPAEQAATERMIALGRQAHADAARERRAHYAALRARRFPLRAAAAWVGVTERTAYRYEQQLRNRP